MKEKEKAYSEQEEKRASRFVETARRKKLDDQQKAFWIIKGMQMAREEEKVG